MMQIDAHHHYWRIDRGDYGWLTADAHPMIARDFLPRDLAPLLTSARIDATILVQAAPTAAETEFLLDLARDDDRIVGVVGWADCDAPDAGDALARLAARPKLVGVRPMVQDIADQDWLTRAALTPVFDAIVRLGLRFDALVNVYHLPALAAVLDRHSDLPVVIDHAAKPDIAGGAWSPWADHLRAIAANSRAFCKLSGLPNEAGAGADRATMQRYVEFVLDTFGVDRVMWGSDWPVVEEAGGYMRWLDLCRSLVPEPAHQKVFGGNAARFYGITP